jgi:preprotein translocase subunit Sss1
MSGEVPIEIEDKPSAVSIMRELVEHLEDTIEALKREIVRKPKSDEYRKALKSTEARLTIVKQILAREEARASHSP